MKENRAACGPIPKRQTSLGSPEIDCLDNDISIFRSHIVELKADIEQAEKDQEGLAYRMALTDSPAREDREKFDRLDETIQSMQNEIRETEIAIRGAEKQIAIERTKVIEEAIRADIAGRQKYLKAAALERIELLEHQLGRASSANERAQIQDKIDNVDALVANEYGHLLRPQRSLAMTPEGHGHSPGEIETEGDVLIQGVTVPGHEYNRIRDQVKQEMRQ